MALSVNQRVGIGFGITLAILAITGIVLGLVLTRAGEVKPTATPTPTPTVTIVPKQNFLLTNGTGQCYEFAKLQSPNSLNLGNCDVGDQWVYYPTINLLSFVAPNYQYCILLPGSQSTGSPVVGGSSSACNGIQIYNKQIIKAPGTGLNGADQCVNNNNGQLQWGNCVTSPYLFTLINQ